MQHNLTKLCVLVSALLYVLISPLSASAASFAKNSIFLSQSSVTQGDTVQIYTVIENDGTSKFTGNLVFDDAGVSIGTLPVTLTPGNGNLLSISWTPNAGSHAISATLKDTDGTVVEKESNTFVVAAIPVPSSGTPQAAQIDSSAPIQGSISNFSPAIATATQPVFSTLDSLRQGAANLLQEQIKTTEPKVLPQVLGVQTTNQSPQPKTALSVWGVLWTGYFYVLTLLKAIVTTAAFFYPILAALFFYALWRLYKRMGRRR